MSTSTLSPPEITRNRQFLKSQSGCHLELVTDEPVAESEPKDCRILFVHGLWHGAWCWEKHFFDYFTERGYPVAAFSWRGHGKSSNSIPSEKRRGWNDYRVNDYLDDLNLVLDHFRGETIVVVGHSMGGYLTQLALQAGSVQAAILLASLPHTGIFGSFLRFARKYPIEVFRVGMTRDLRPAHSSREMVSDLLFSGNASQEDILETHQNLLPESYRVFLEAFVPWRMRRSRVKGRVAVIASDNDAYIGRGETEKMAGFYGTRAKFISGGGHDMMLDNAWRLAANAVEREAQALLELAPSVAY